MIPIMINDVPLDCINRAAIIYRIPAALIITVLKQESGKNGDAIKNKNGTFDYGVMQINSIWLPRIAAYGYTKEDMQYNACKNISVGTWILSQSIAEGKNLWSGIGNYHSHTPKHNYKYRDAIQVHYKKIVSILDT
ncbi:MAG: lytic transglycosylase domain-containing protein [Gammaproteobacteria bacterium]|nr:lytic transglycosylase domain-containing protein [Gammaproteobacteria bacterium]